MPIDSIWLRQLIAARRFEDLGRRLPEAKAADLAGIPTDDLLTYLGSLSDSGLAAVPASLLDEVKRRRPTELEPAILLASRLALVGSVEDAARVIEAAVDAAADKELVAWGWISQLVAMGRVDDARAELTRDFIRHVSPAMADLLVARIAMMEQRFDDAAVGFEAISRRLADKTQIRGTVDRARHCAALAARFAAARRVPEGPADYAVFAINLDDQAERFRLLMTQFPGDRPAVIRVPGVKGRYLPDIAATRLAGPGAEQRKGTLGCFLGHVAAWERFRASSFPHGLIVEDDAIVVIELPPALAALGLPAGYDLCFASHGMEAPPPPAPTSSLHAVPVADLQAVKPESWRAPGGHGYFLSRAGVEKLLAWVARDGFFGDVDWRLLAYSLRRAGCEKWPADGFIGETLRRHRAHIQADEPLAAWCLYPALMLPGRVGSIRQADNISD